MRCLCVYTTDPFSNTDLSIGRPDRPLESLLFVPFGIASIATCLKQAGHTVRLVVLLDQPESEERMARELEAFDPHLVCFTSVSSKFRSVKALSRVTRRVTPRAYVLIGGHHATLAPESVAREESFDGICIGEGEEAVLELAEQLEKGLRPSGILNLWLRGPGGVQKNPPRPFIEDLDSLHHIDRGMWDEWVEKRSSPSLLLGRGCPFKCTYCSNHVLARVAPGKYVRLRSPQDVVRELEAIDGLYGNVESVYLEVETFGANARYSNALCDALEELNRRRATPLRFGINMNVYRRALEGPELFERMRRAGFAYVNVGLESGSERIRKDVLRRPHYTNDDFVKFCGLVKQHGMAVAVYALLGLPEETAEDARMTVEVLRRGQPSSLLPSFFFPYPGTDLYKKVVAAGLLDEEKFFEAFQGNQERYQARIDFPGLSRRRIMWLGVTLHYRVYKGVWTLRQRLKITIFALLYVFPRLRPLRFVLLGGRLERLRRSTAALFSRIAGATSG